MHQNIVPCNRSSRLSWGGCGWCWLSWLAPSVPLTSTAMKMDTVTSRHPSGLFMEAENQRYVIVCVCVGGVVSHPVSTELCMLGPTAVRSAIRGLLHSGSMFLISTLCDGNVDLRPCARLHMLRRMGEGSTAVHVQSICIPVQQCLAPSHACAWHLSMIAISPSHSLSRSPVSHLCHFLCRP
jgi:hypothetical protein